LFLWNALERYPNASGHSFGMVLILERSGSQHCGTTRRYILTPVLSFIELHLFEHGIIQVSNLLYDVDTNKLLTNVSPLCATTF